MLRDLLRSNPKCHLELKIRLAKKLRRYVKRNEKEAPSSQTLNPDPTDLGQDKTPGFQSQTPGSKIDQQ